MVFFEFFIYLEEKTIFIFIAGILYFSSYFQYFLTNLLNKYCSHKMEVNVAEIKLENQTEQVAKENEMESVKNESLDVSTKKENETGSTNKEDLVESVKNEGTDESVEKEDPFAYLDRNDFTSEKYKIEIRNLPKHYGIAVSSIIFEMM